MESITILYEDKQIIVCEKPCGVPSQSDKTGDFDMVNRLKNYLFEKEETKGEPYIGLVHRLDRPVGGIMVFAKTPLAAKTLSEQVRNKTFQKWYLAVVEKDLKEIEGKEKILLTDYLVRDGRNNLSKVTTKENKNAKKAELYYQVLQVKDGLSLVRVELLTGRHHQIRVQLSAHLGGLYGDTKYNVAAKEKKGWQQIALYASEISFLHPKTKEKMCFKKEPEGEVFERF